MFIDREQIDEYEVHQFSAFASDVGLTAKYIHTFGWPRRIDTNAGNGQPLMLQRMDVRDGDLQSVNYRQSLGCITLCIFND